MPGTLKITDNNSAVAYHVVQGATTFPYAIDAQQAISQHPDEWSAEPWSAADAASARKKLDLPEPEVSPEEQAAIDEHAKAVAEAQARLDAFRKKQAEETEQARQVAADEALVASPPPQVDPNFKRPFGRKGPPTQAEIDAANKKAAAKDQAAASGSTQKAEPTTFAPASPPTSK
jgi:hypothetical protein